MKYVDPSTDTDLNGSALPDGQAPQGTPKPTPAPAPRDQTQTLDILSDGGETLDKLRADAAATPPAPAPAKDPDSPTEPKGDSGDGKPDGSGGNEPAGDGKPVAEPTNQRPPAIPTTPVANDEVVDPDDGLDDLQPPPGTTKKTAEAWDSFKAKAKETVAQAEARVKQAEEARAKVEAELEEARKIAASALTEEQKKEVEDLRKWRAAQEIETAPELTTLEEKITSNTDALLAKLKEAGMDDKQIGEIRKLGVRNVNWEELKPHMSVQLRQFVDAKLFSHVNLEEEKATTRTKLKSEGEAYLKKRQEAQQAEVQRRTQTFEAALKTFSEAKPFAFLKPTVAPKGATPEQVKLVEEDNKFAKELSDNIEAWKKHLDEPEMRAELLFGSVMAYKIQRDLVRANQQIEALKAELKEQTDKFERVKRASGAGRRSGTASVPPAAPGSDFVDSQGRIKDAGSALDELAASMGR